MQDRYSEEAPGRMRAGQRSALLALLGSDMVGTGSLTPIRPAEFLLRWFNLEGGSALVLLHAKQGLISGLCPAPGCVVSCRCARQGSRMSRTALRLLSLWSQTSHTGGMTAGGSQDGGVHPPWVLLAASAAMRDVPLYSSCYRLPREWCSVVEDTSCWLCGTVVSITHMMDRTSYHACMHACPSLCRCRAGMRLQS
jgi:hypothetical protein